MHELHLFIHRQNICKIFLLRPSNILIILYFLFLSPSFHYLNLLGYNLTRTIFRHQNYFTDSKIPMTAPVLREVIHGPGPACESTFMTHFMIPFSLQSKTPTPTDPRVYLREVPTMKVFVRWVVTRRFQLQLLFNIIIHVRAHGKNIFIPWIHLMLNLTSSSVRE